MPGIEFYGTLPMPEALRAFAEHHFAEETRHISAF